MSEATSQLPELPRVVTDRPRGGRGSAWLSLAPRPDASLGCSGPEGRPAQTGGEVLLLAQGRLVLAQEGEKLSKGGLGVDRLEVEGFEDV